jgi:hypothetical protein
MKILLPENLDKREYIVFLLKHVNNIHVLNDRDLTNLIKLKVNGYLNENDYPNFK